MTTTTVHFYCEVGGHDAAQEVATHGNGVPMFPGYGVAPDGRKACYQCCANSDRADMIATGRACLYLSDGKVTNWPGSLSFAVGPVRTGRHNMARRRYDFDFVGPDGARWHGTQYGDNTQVAHCRRLKTA